MVFCVDCDSTSDKNGGLGAIRSEWRREEGSKKMEMTPIDFSTECDGTNDKLVREIT